jgi:hypothetical protein
LYNHKYYRPIVVVDDIELRHLLLPDVSLYIFNFFFDSTSYTINDESIDIDLQSKAKYGSIYAYPLLLFINGQFGLQEISGKQLYFPNTLNEFANKFRAKYQDKKEEAVEVDYVKFVEELKLDSAKSAYEDIRQIFGPIFAEA